MTPTRIGALEQLASTFIGDGKTPDLFFVTINGIVVLVTQHYTTAYIHWRELTPILNPVNETSLENRTFGVIASLEPDEETGMMDRMDNSAMFEGHK